MGLVKVVAAAAFGALLAASAANGFPAPRATSPPARGRQAAAPAPYRSPTCDAPTSRDEANECSQARAANAARDQATWALLQLIVGAIGAGAVVVTIWFTAKATRAASASVKVARASAIQSSRSATAAAATVEIARKAYLAEHRPWVSVDAIINTDLTMTDGKLALGFKFAMRNYGRTPAQKVWIDSALNIGSHTMLVAAEVEARRLAPRVGPPGIFKCVFPQQETHLDIIRSNEDEVHPGPETPAGRVLLLTLSGVLCYQEALADGPIHYTSFVFQVRRFEPPDDVTKATRVLATAPNGNWPTIPRAELSLVPWTSGWFAD
jgi:hypothetical protein